MVAPDLYDDKPLSADMTPEQRQERMGQLWDPSFLAQAVKHLQEIISSVHGSAVGLQVSIQPNCCSRAAFSCWSLAVNLVRLKMQPAGLLLGSKAHRPACR